MSLVMDDEIKRWTARRKSALVLEIIQGKTTVAEASRACDLPPSEIETWIEDGKKGMENALRANPAGRGREVIETIRQGLKDDGLTVSISQLCRWFDVPRRTVYYPPTRKSPRYKTASTSRLNR
jgi:Transposase